MPEIEHYNLVSKPFIIARMSDGTTRELSLKETFALATDIRCLVGELPTSVFAQLRLLLAILLSAVQTDENIDLDRAPGARWCDLWQAETLPTEVIDSYLGEFEDRFDILHATHPFMQVAGLRTAAAEKGEVGLQRLIPDVSSNGLFAMRMSDGMTRISFAEAARHLVHAHAFGVSGIYPAGTDDSGTDPRAKGGKVYPLGNGPAGNLGGVIVEGHDLRETLLLNLVLGRAANIPFNDEESADRPVWERDQLAVEPEVRIPPGPRGQADVFTWQSRRIRLLHDGDGVTGAVICYGDPLAPQNLHTVETMSAFRYSEPQSKKAGAPVYMPIRHSSSRALWRGLASVLPQTTQESRTKTPGSVGWLTELAERDMLPPGLVIRTRAIGIEYGTQNSVIDEVVDDTIDLRLALLQDKHRALAQAAVEMVGRTEDAVRGLGRLAENLALAAGADRDLAASVRDSEAAEGYSIVDGAFRQWLALLEAETDVEQARVAWARQARSLLRARAEWLVEDAGVPAWIGRPSDGGKPLNSARAFSWFAIALNKALGTEQPRPDGDPTRKASVDDIEEIA